MTKSVKTLGKMQIVNKPKTYCHLKASPCLHPPPPPKVPHNSSLDIWGHTNNPNKDASLCSVSTALWHMYNHDHGILWTNMLKNIIMSK